MYCKDSSYSLNNALPQPSSSLLANSLDKVNNIEYKGSKLFVVQFLPWEKSNNMFTITYAKKYDMCFTCDKEKKAYEKQSKK